MPEISIIIPIYNALNDLKILLNSLNKNINFDICEIFLINDCSNSETSSFLKSFSKQHKQYIYIQNEYNLGFVQTCNKGMKLAQGKIVVLLNSDTEIPAGFCNKIIECFEANDEIGIASPIGGSIPIPDNLDTEKMNALLNEVHKTEYPLLSFARGYCYCIRKEVIEEQGYLDTVWGKGYGEEIDYSFRAITNGWKNVLIDNLFVYHKNEASFGKETREKYIEQNRPEFEKRWKNFQKKYEKKHKIKNSLQIIEQKMFPNGNPARPIIPKFKRKAIEYIFSLKNTPNKSHKVMTILGVQFKFKRCN